MEKQFAVIGQDGRQQAVREYLRQKGYRLCGAGQLGQADYILLPLPLPESFGLILRAAKPGAILLGGRVSPAARAAAGQAGVALLDYLDNPALAELNAIPTGEAAIALLLQNRKKVLWQQPVLVLGYGRVGRNLALRLAALGAKVTVAARRPLQQAEAQAAGLAACGFADLPQVLPGQDTVVNTVPALVLGQQVLALLPAEAFVLDLASDPGGVDQAAAKALGVNTLQALRLPGKNAPITAGQFTAQTILQILKEKGEPV